MAQTSALAALASHGGPAVPSSPMALRQARWEGEEEEGGPTTLVRFHGGLLLVGACDPQSILSALCCKSLNRNPEGACCSQEGQDSTKRPVAQDREALDEPGFVGATEPCLYTAALQEGTQADETTAQMSRGLSLLSG